MVERAKEAGAEANLITFNTLANACNKARPQGKGYAEQLFQQMVEVQKIAPNQISLMTLGLIVGRQRLYDLCDELGVDYDAIMKAKFGPELQKRTLSRLEGRGQAVRCQRFFVEEAVDDP